MTHKRAVRDDQEQMSTDGQQISDPSSPPPAKKSRTSELARFYEAAVKGRTLRSTAPGQIGQGKVFYLNLIKYHKISLSNVVKSFILIYFHY